MIEFKLEDKTSLLYICECIIAAGSAILQGGIFGLSSMFPGKYTQAVMGGMVRIKLLLLFLAALLLKQSAAYLVCHACVCM